MLKAAPKKFKNEEVKGIISAGCFFQCGLGEDEEE